MTFGMLYTKWKHSLKVFAQSIRKVFAQSIRSKHSLKQPLFGSSSIWLQI